MTQPQRAVEIEDLFQLGFLELLEADQQYQGPAEGFSKYARGRIRAAMLTGIPGGEMGSRRLQRVVRHLDKSSQWLEQSLGRTPKPVEFADAGGLTLKAYQAVVRESHGLRKSPGKPAVKSSPDIREGEFADPLQFALQRSEIRCMKQALRKLPRRVRKMLRMHYADGIKLRIIGSSYGMTESRVSQILSRALLQLRVRMT